MRLEEELLEMFKNVGLDSYKVNTESEVTKSIQLMSIEDLIEFSCKHNIDTMFYSYTFIDEDVLSITDETISNLRLSEEQLAVLQDKFDEYNESLSQLDFSNPISLNVYCINQGIIFFIQEDDYWFIEEGFGMPETACIELVTENFEDIAMEKEKRMEQISEGREKLRQQILNDEEFKKCTNMQLRKIYADKMFRTNSENKDLFYSKIGGLYDIPINYFVEEIWKEYKDSLKK